MLEGEGLAGFWPITTRDVWPPPGVVRSAGGETGAHSLLFPYPSMWWSPSSPNHFSSSTAVPRHPRGGRGGAGLFQNPPRPPESSRTLSLV